MQLGYQLSIAGHIAFVALTFLSWPVPEDTPEAVVVSVSIVTEAPDAPQPQIPDAPTLPEPPAPPAPSPPPKPQEPEPAPAPAEQAPATLPPPQAPKVSSEISITPESAPQVDTTAPSATELDPPKEPQNEAEPKPAPDQTTTQIVTEADAATQKLPQLRPADLDVSVAAKPDPEPKPDPKPAAPVNEGVTNALQQALEQARQTSPPATPLTSVEQANFKLSVEACWNVDIGSLAANIIVTVGFSLTPDGKVDASSIRLISASGTPQEAIQSAFGAARRAILICGRGGYDLPAEKYEVWKNVELTFDPSNMR